MIGWDVAARCGAGISNTSAARCRAGTCRRSRDGSRACVCGARRSIRLACAQLFCKLRHLLRWIPATESGDRRIGGREENRPFFGSSPCAPNDAQRRNSYCARNVGPARQPDLIRRACSPRAVSSSPILSRALHSRKTGAAHCARARPTRAGAGRDVGLRSLRSALGTGKKVPRDPSFPFLFWGCSGCSDLL